MEDDLQVGKIIKDKETPLPETRALEKEGGVPRSLTDRKTI